MGIEATVKIKGGSVYSKTLTMVNDGTTSFETESKILRDIIILVETNEMLMGKAKAEVFPVEVGGVIGITKVDISCLYFKNKVAGQNGVITILAVED